MSQDEPRPDRSRFEPSADLLRALSQYPNDIARLLDELSRPVTDEDTLLDLMHRTSREAVRMLDEVHWAGVTAQFAGPPFTAANSDTRVLVVDEAQYGQGDGPCLHSMRSDQVVAMSDEEVAERWPRLAETARSVGVRAFHAEPLHARGHAVGSLNLYSAADGVLNPDPDLLTVFTGYLDRGLTDYSATQAGEPDALRLQNNLRRRHLVNQAVGVLMGIHGISAAEALQNLTELAGADTALEDVARDVLDQHTRASNQDPDLA